ASWPALQGSPMPGPAIHQTQTLIPSEARMKNADSQAASLSSILCASLLKPNRSISRSAITTALKMTQVAVVGVTSTWAGNRRAIGVRCVGQGGRAEEPAKTVHKRQGEGGVQPSPRLPP